MFGEISNQGSNGFLSGLADNIRNGISQIIEGTPFSGILPILDILTWIIILFLIDFLLVRVFGYIIKFFLGKSKLKWTSQFYKHKVFRTLVHFFTVSLILAVNPVVFQKYPGIDKLTDKFIGLMIISLFVLFVFRLIDSILAVSEDDEESYAKVGLRTMTQLIKVIVVFFGFLAFIATLVNVELSQIFTILGALTAVILLIFKDSLLGFIAGIQLATSQSIKVGDWISVSKYKIEGNVKEINLAITKIENFDKTLSTVPTYDLISSEVTNFSRMSATNTRRIKRAIVFNINSFRFCDNQMLDDFGKIDLIQDYIREKRIEIDEINKNIAHPELIINGKNLTNIGTFRIYAQNYLKSRTEVSQNDTIVVRQLQQTSAGLPLEIYCFATDSAFVGYERIQSDIFDHLITASKKFGLVISQPFIIEGTND